MDWRPVDTLWRPLGVDEGAARALPATFEMPETPWHYGAVTDLIQTTVPVTFRVRLIVESGSAAIAFLAEDYSTLNSVQRRLTTDDGEIVLDIRLLPRKAPARLLLRAADEAGGARVAVLDLEMSEDPVPEPPLDYAALTVSNAPCESPAGHYPLIEILVSQAPNLALLRPYIARTLSDIEVGEVFTLDQALVLAAAVRDLRPDVVLDLGTGRGGSAISMALADPDAQVYTFDNEPQWDGRIDFLLNDLPSNVHPIVTDIVNYDYAALLTPAARVLVFWDAHGYDIAARVLAHIMPIIADKPHIVFCHDIDDSRYLSSEHSGSYGGKRMWRGYDHYISNLTTTDKLRMGWMWTGMDQGVAMLDFAQRNETPLDSVEHEMHMASPETLVHLAQAFPNGAIARGMAYFTMNQTRLRHFPAS